MTGASFITPNSFCLIRLRPATIAAPSRPGTAVVSSARCSNRVGALESRTLSARSDAERGRADSLPADQSIEIFDAPTVLGDGCRPQLRPGHLGGRRRLGGAPSDRSAAQTAA